MRGCPGTTAMETADVIGINRAGGNPATTQANCSPLGCAEAIMLAHGFTVEILGCLVLGGARDVDAGVCCWADDQGDLAEDHGRRAARARERVVTGQPQGTEAHCRVFCSFLLRSPDPNMLPMGVGE
jgi:hypothetical protein